MAEKYRPQSKNSYFSVPTYWIDAELPSNFSLSNSIKTNAIASHYSSLEKFLLPVHPGAVDFFPGGVKEELSKKEEGPTLVASPTSSTRTVYIHENELFGTDGHFLKLHFPGRISRFGRELTPGDVRHQLWVSDQLNSLTIPHLSELAGGYTSFSNNYAFGYLVRSMYPESLASPDHEHIFPLFSMYGNDALSVDHPPLILQLAKIFGESNEVFLFSRIIEPCIRLWIKIVTELGLIPEMHGQNTLMSLNVETGVSSIFLRDMDMFVDFSIRKKNNLDCSGLSQTVNEEYYLNGSERLLSLTYDGFLCNHFFEPLVSLCMKHSTINRSKLVENAKLLFTQLGGNDLPFTSDSYYFGQNILPDNSFNLELIERDQLYR